MKESISRSLIAAFVVISVVVGTASADPYPYHASIDLSGIAGSDFELEVALYDNSGVIGDSHALIDNVVFGAESDDFESGIGGFVVDPFNPGSVNVVGGSLNGSGASVLRIDEDPFVTPTLAYRDYTGSAATSLSFDFQMFASDTVGLFGQDELVFSILDPVTFDPLLPDLTGFGDVLAVNYDGMIYTDDVAVSVVPVPGALLLGMLGFGTFGALRKLKESV
jgi:hypothetical protein